MRKNKPSYWTYSQNVNQHLPDPRIRIARHIGWQKNTGDDTSYSVPEPDNYNRAVITDTAVECPFIENQVIYKDSVRNGWICVMLVAEEQSGEYTAWLKRLAPKAHWHHYKAPKLKKSRCIPL
jgi:hypothetical protein